MNSIVVNDKKFFGYIKEMLLDFENYPFILPDDTKILMRDLKVILKEKTLSVVLLNNLVPYLINQLNVYETQFKYDLVNQVIHKMIYEEQKYILSYIKKYFIINEYDCFISISINFNDLKQAS